MIRRELRDSTPIWKLSNHTWDANPSHPMPLVFCTAIHRSSPTYLWRNKSQDSQAPEKNHVLETWFRLRDRHRPCPRQRQRGSFGNTEMSSMVGAEMGDMLPGLPQEGL